MLALTAREKRVRRDGRLRLLGPAGPEGAEAGDSVSRQPHKVREPDGHGRILLEPLLKVVGVAGPYRKPGAFLLLGL